MWVGHGLCHSLFLPHLPPHHKFHVCGYKILIQMTFSKQQVHSHWKCLQEREHQSQPQKVVQGMFHSMRYELSMRLVFCLIIPWCIVWNSTNYSTALIGLRVTGCKRLQQQFAVIAIFLHLFAIRGH